MSNFNCRLNTTKDLSILIRVLITDNVVIKLVIELLA